MSVPSNELINQFVTELGYISVANGYLNNFVQVRPDYISLNINNDFDSICVYQGNDKPDNFDNANRPQSFVMDIFVAFHIRSNDVSGDLTYKIESVKQDMLKWLYRGPGITANKWCTVGETNVSNTLAIWQGYTLDTIVVGRDPDTSIARIIFPLKVEHDAENWALAGLTYLGEVTRLHPANPEVVNSPDFTWQALAGAISYDIEVYDLPGTTLLASQNDILVTTWAAPSSLMPIGHSYTWRIRANNAIGHGAWNALWIFDYEP